jgi:hypothetical protein
VVIGNKNTGHRALQLSPTVPAAPACGPRSAVAVDNPAGSRPPAKADALLGAVRLVEICVECVRCPTGVIVYEEHALRRLCRGNALEDLHVVGELVAVEARIGQLDDRRLGAVGLKDGYSGIGRIACKAIRPLVCRPFGYNLSVGTLPTTRLGRSVKNIVWRGTS